MSEEGSKALPLLRFGLEKELWISVMMEVMCIAKHFIGDIDVF
ncbi:MAG: hypothetical protein ABIN89_29685 [Chitinophagaceae bacterium]